MRHKRVGPDLEAGKVAELGVVMVAQRLLPDLPQGGEERVADVGGADVLEVGVDGAREAVRDGGEAQEVLRLWGPGGGYPLLEWSTRCNPAKFNQPFPFTAGAGKLPHRGCSNQVVTQMGPSRPSGASGIDMPWLSVQERHLPGAGCTRPGALKSLPSQPPPPAPATA